MVTTPRVGLRPHVSVAVRLEVAIRVRRIGSQLGRRRPFRRSSRTIGRRSCRRGDIDVPLPPAFPVGGQTVNTSSVQPRCSAKAAAESMSAHSRPFTKGTRGSQHRLAGRPAAGSSAASSAHASKYFGQSAHHHLTRPISANVAPACMQGRGNDNCSSKTPNQDHKQGVATSSRRQEPARTVVELCLRGRGPRPLVYRKPRFPCVFAN